MNLSRPESSFALIPATFPPGLHEFLEPFLPPVGPTDRDSSDLPHVTLTYASSLDATLTVTPGIHTDISGPMSTAMTHYLRSRHAAILVGVGTAIADDPALTCRLEGFAHHQPRPVVVDPRGRWPVSRESRVVRTASQGRGKGVWVLVAEEHLHAFPAERRAAVEGCGGKVLSLPVKRRTGQTGGPWFDWEDILRALADEEIESVMVEGGGGVHNELLRPEHAGLLSTLVITIAPVFLGQGGVVIRPPRRAEQNPRPLRLRDVAWHSLGNDGVMCGRMA